MHQLRNLTVLLITIFCISSCGPTIKTTGSWVNKEKLNGPKKSQIFVVALIQNIEARDAIENDIANAATARNIKTVKSLSVFGVFGTKEQLPTEERLLAKVKETGCDAIFTISVVDKQSETRYVPGTNTYYAPYPTYGYYGRFGGYYGYSSSFYNPGYYTTDKTYFLETNVYDANTQEILFSMQSKATNPSNIKKYSAAYTALVVQELKERGVLK